MKKFEFSLDTVKNYKDTELDALKKVHGQIMAKVNKQEALVNALEAECQAEIEEFDEKKMTGVTVVEAQSFDIHIQGLHKRIRYERRELAHLQREAERARLEVVEKKKEISSIEKLREKRVEEYNKEALKEEENFIEEIVLNKRAAMG